MTEPYRLRVVDFETTGMAPPALVIEAGICDVFGLPDQWEIGGWASQFFSAPFIPPEVRAIHHISMADIGGARPFNRMEFIEHAMVDGVMMVAAHNWAFEAQWLDDCPLKAICTYKAALRVWPEAPSHSNGALRYWLEDQRLIAPEHALTQPAHRAGPDAYVTAHILRLLLHEVGGRQLEAWTREPALYPTCPLSKWRGKKWAEVDSGFLTWMLDAPDMAADLKWNATRELTRRRDHVTEREQIGRTA